MISKENKLLYVDTIRYLILGMMLFFLQKILINLSQFFSKEILTGIVAVVDIFSILFFIQFLINMWRILFKNDPIIKKFSIINSTIEDKTDKQKSLVSFLWAVVGVILIFAIILVALKIF